MANDPGAGGPPPPSFGSFMALGDSFTEGMNDPDPDGTMRGWADRLAGVLAQGAPGLRYANLAVRGKLLDQIVAEQLPVALAAAPELVGFSAGGNDILRRGGDPDEIAGRYEDAVGRLRGAGSQVLVFTGFDVGHKPVLRLARGRIAIYNEHLRTIARRHRCVLVDLWALTPLRDPRAFSEDRLHLSPDGHERVARLAACELGVAAGDPYEDWPVSPPSPLHPHREDLLWAREHLLPWVGRHLRGRSSGDGMAPKRPELETLESA